MVKQRKIVYICSLVNRCLEGLHLVFIKLSSPVHASWVAQTRSQKVPGLHFFLHWISSLGLEIQCKYFIFSSSVDNNQSEESKRIEEFFEEKMFCHHCDDSLAGHRYVLRDDHPYCIKCYENVFANNCDECGKIIGIDSKDLSYKEKHWHEACFVCSKCRTSLVDKQFGSKADRIYCGPCYDAQFATRCDGCGDVFRAGKNQVLKMS